MSVRIVIAGDTQCKGYTQVCLVADHLSRNLPSFCYEKICKGVTEWGPWLVKMNAKNLWHHQGSPLVWKELLAKGTKAYYIGGASEFWEYCHAYYNLDVFMSEKVFSDLYNGIQYQIKLSAMKKRAQEYDQSDEASRSPLVVCVTGAGHGSTQQLVSGLLEMSDASGGAKVSQIYLYDGWFDNDDLEELQTDCGYVATQFPGRVVRVVDKLGSALAESDLLIVMDHVAFRPDMDIEEWLILNVEKMLPLADFVNISAKNSIRIIFPNFGPSCFNATILSRSTKDLSRNIVVATSDLGLEALGPASEIAGVPLRTMFCPPVWGFVGINHLVDIRTTYHRYSTFRPYPRYVKVNNSTLKVGSLTPEMRTLEYLMHWDRDLWMRVAERKKLHNKDESMLAHKIVSLLGLIKLWFFDCSEDNVASVGVTCNGSFGLTLKGLLSQPARLINGLWEPAQDYPLPRDPYVTLKYLETTAKTLLDETNIPSHMLRRYASSIILLKQSQSCKSLDLSVYLQSQQFSSTCSPEELFDEPKKVESINEL